MKFLKTIDTFDYYKFQPSPFRLFYKNYEPMYFKKRIRFLLEYIYGYSIIYMEKNDEILGYSVVANWNSRYSSFADKKDIVIGPYFIKDEHRGKGYSEIMVKNVLENMGLKYLNAYMWIRFNNTPSLKCSQRVGFVKLSNAKISGYKRKIYLSDEENEEYIVVKYSKKIP